MKTPLICIAFSLSSALFATAAHAESKLAGHLKDRIAQHLGVNAVTLIDEHGSSLIGFAGATYKEDETVAVALIAETSKVRILYAETCDLCGEILSVDKASGAIETIEQGHALSCEHLPDLSEQEPSFTVCE